MLNETPATKTARQTAISQILASNDIESQKQLRRLLQEQGISSTQSTISRDLEELKVRKEKKPNGKSCYVLNLAEDPPLPNTSVPEQISREKLRTTCREYLLTVLLKDDFVIARTLPGGGQLVGSFIDNGKFPGVLASIAGDDTVLVICLDVPSAENLRENLLHLEPRK